MCGKSLAPDWAGLLLDPLVDTGRHTALGQYVTLGVGRELDVDPPSGAGKVPDFAVDLDPLAGRATAATVAADNGTFVELHHDGSITVGNDGRDIAETFNTGRESLDGGPSGRGGAVMITFAGTYRPSRLRENNFLVKIPARERPALNRRYPGEYVIDDGKIGSSANAPETWFR